VKKILGIAMVLMTTCGVASAAAVVASAPEIDPASAMSGLTLLLGGIAVIRGRRAGK
jgi:hypothetical protein